MEIENPVTYRYPIKRYFTFFAFALVVDMLVSVFLWMGKPDKREIMHTIKHYSIAESVFDLACISVGRCILLIPMLAKLEALSTSAAQGDSANNQRKITWLKSFSFMIVLGSIVFCIYKGVRVILSFEDHTVTFKTTQYALCISATIFSLLFSVILLGYFQHLKRLQCFYARFPDDLESSGSSGGCKENKPKKKVNLGRLLSLLKPEAWKLLFGTIGLIGSTVSNMLAPLWFGKVIQAAMSSMHDLNTETINLFIIYLVGGAAAFFRSWLYTLVGQSLVARIRKFVFAHIIAQEIAFFDTNRTGELMNRLSSDSQVIQNALSVNISMLFRYALQIIGSVAIMFYVSPKLGGVLLAVIPLVGILAQRYGAFVRDVQKSFQDELAKSASSAEETISAIRTVRSFSQEPKANQEYGEAIDNSFMSGSKLSLASGVFNAIIAVLTTGAIVLVLWYGGKLVHDGEMNVGELTSFILYALNVAMAFAFLSSLYGDFMKAAGASIRIFELLDRSPELVPGKVRMTDAKVEVSFNDVYFSYPARPDNQVLKGFSFKMSPGETIALVGPSGGGKSTVINLLERFYDPSQGFVKLGNNLMIDIDTNWFRKRVGIVSQEPVLFAKTIAENIAYGRDATQEEIEDAARRANAHEFITGFEDSYKTNVGERGIKLSGGQKQRIAIARALIMDPDILLLDEATSALDAESEHLVQEAIDRAMVGRTVLVIAHRLSTVRDASRVIVISKGTIAEQGTHNELLEYNGVYKRLVLRQLEKNAGDYLEDADNDSM